MKVPHILSSSFILALTLVAQAQTQSLPVPCANTLPCGPAGSTYCYPCNEGEGANPFYPSGGNVARHVTDLTLGAGVGQHRLGWSRTGFSRFNPGKTWFGDGHGWRHRYQYEMVYAGTSGGNPLVDLLYPDGSVYRFTRVNNVWTGVAACPDKLSQDGAHFYLQTSAGWRYHFERFANGDGTNYYQFQDFADTEGNIYPLTYDGSRRLVLVAEPAGRYLTIGYQQITANRADFETLKTITSTPPASQWTEQTVTNTTAFRYLRLYSGINKFLSAAEIEFYDENNQLIIGTPIGTAGLSGQGFAKALDGNVSTSFRADNKTYGYAGLDLGVGNAKRVSKVRYYPRAGSAGDLVGAKFEGSNVAPELQSVIASVTASDGRSVNYSYDLFDDAMLATDYVTLAGAAYGDGTAATYVYGQTWPGVRPVMTEANDPRGEGRADRMKYEYWTTGGIQGAIKAERNGVTGSLIAQLEGLNDHSSKVTYANGATRRFDFPSANASQTITRVDGLERRTTYTYGAGGQGFRASETDPLNRTTSYSRSPFGNLLGVTHPDNSTESWTRDSLDLVLTHTDELGRVTTWTRDVQHRVTRIDYPDQSFETFTYNAVGQVLTHTHRNGGAESFVYDARGLKTSHTDATNAVTTYAYDARDLLASVTDARNHTTRYEYNERGLLTKITHPDDSTVLYTYDTYGNRTSMTNELGKVWTYGYDEFSRRVTITDPLNRTTTYSYAIGAAACGSCHSDDTPTQVTLPSGRITKFTYDAEWQKLSETVGVGSAEAATTGYAYDAVGSVLTITDPRGKLWTHTYDARNRRLTAADPLGNTTTWTYDATGNKLTETRSDNGVTTMTYDVMNRVVTTTNPNNETTTFTYGGRGMIADDKGDNLVRLTDARSHSYDFTYDYRNRKTRMGYPDLTDELWTYDGVGNNVTYTTRAGQVKTCTLDNRDRDILCDWSDTTPDITKSYDSVGRVLTMVSSVSALSYTYDDANQLLSETQDINSPVDLGAKTVGYTYDADGNRASLTYPDGTVVQYSYTARNQMKEIIADGPPPLATYSYDLAGNRTGKTLENGTSTTYTYDDASRLTNLSHALTINGASSSISYGYGLNSVGNRTSRTETIAGTAKMDSYGYDPTDQITQVKYNHNPGAGTTDRQVDYAFDATGNRTTVTEDADGTGPNPAVPTPYTANNLNQYTAIDSLAAPAYDANGNLTTHQPKPGDPTWTYTYDAQNRLISGTNTAGGSLTFSYDPRNRCVTRAINGVTTLYLFDEWTLIDERNQSDAQIAGYVHGSVIDELITLTNATGTAYYHHDALGSTIALSSSAGSVLETVTYDVYGAPMLRESSGAVLTASNVGNRFLFKGRESIQEVKIVDYRNRAYLVEVGRFSQIDPMRFDARDNNLYRYVFNSVANDRDPTGLINFKADFPCPDALKGCCVIFCNSIGKGYKGCKVRISEGPRPDTVAVTWICVCTLTQGRR